MLPRAALRSLRLRPAFAVPRTSPVTSTSPWIRSYASDKRRSTKPAKDNTWKPSDQIKFAESDKAIPVNPTEQPEFDTPAAPEQNTTPTEAPGPGVSEAQTPDAQQLYTKEQAEFVGPTSPEQNTDPTTEDLKHPTTMDPKQPQKPLPDLRYGIPSTFGDEFGTAESKAKEQEHDPNNITEDPAREPAPGGGGREGGELPKSAYETSTDRRRNRWANYSYIGALVSGVLGVVFLGRNWDDEADEKAHPDAPNGWSLPAMQKRITARFSNQMGYYTEPTFEKLLPEVEQRPPLTLVISLEDLLIHSEWTSKNGWRVAKRPGVDYFIRYLQQYYELVIWTSVKSMDADPIIRKLDPFRMIMWPLFREATRYEGGEYVKDLSHLNRDLDKTIIIDTNPSHVQRQPENAIVLPKWTGDPKDKSLVALIPFLEYLATMHHGDKREALKSFEGKNIATEFAKREAKAREEFNKQLAETKTKTKGSAGNFVMGALGLKGPQQPTGLMLTTGQSASEAMAQGKMLSDQFREMGQKNYEAIEKEIRENGEKWLKEMAEEEKKFAEEQMKSMKSGVFNYFGGPPSQK